MLTEKLTEFSIELANKDLEEMKEADLDKYDQTEEMLVSLTQVATHFLTESPEFRREFAKIHAKFLEYPESRQVIEKSLSAYAQYEQ